MNNLSVRSSIFRVGTTTIAWILCCVQKVESGQLFWKDTYGSDGSHTVNRKIPTGQEGKP